MFVGGGGGGEGGVEEGQVEFVLVVQFAAALPATAFPFPPTHRGGVAGASGVAATVIEVSVGSALSDGDELVEDDEFDLEFERVSEVLGGFFGEMFVGVGEDHDDEVDEDDPDIYVDEVVFHALDVDFFVGGEHFDGAPDVEAGEEGFLEEEGELRDAGHDAVVGSPLSCHCVGWVVGGPEGDPKGDLDDDGGSDDEAEYLCGH